MLGDTFAFPCTPNSMITKGIAELPTNRADTISLEDRKTKAVFQTYLELFIRHVKSKGLTRRGIEP